MRQRRRRRTNMYKRTFFLLLPFYLKPPYRTDGFLGTLLKFFYYDPSNPASFVGPDKFYRFVRKGGQFVLSNYKIRKLLQRQEPYSLQRPLKRSFRRNKDIVKGINDPWDIDLMDMTKFANYNNGYNFIFVVIDIFSKYAWLGPLQDKKG
jgi:hypothetical protein